MALLTWPAMGEAANQLFFSLVASAGFDLYIQHELALPIVPASLGRCMQDGQSSP